MYRGEGRLMYRLSDKEGWCRIERDQTLPILKKDRKIYLRSDSTVLDQILLIFKNTFKKKFRSNSTLF